MKHKDLRIAYSNFFKTEAGQHLLAELDRLIQADHTCAEDQPELALAYTSRAKGVREVANHIQSILTESKKGGAE